MMTKKSRFIRDLQKLLTKRDAYVQGLLAKAGTVRGAVLYREAKFTPEEDAVDRARWNGTLALLARQIQKAHWRANLPCDDSMAEQIAVEKIAGRVKLPPKLGPEHIGRCPRCGRAHLLPLTKDERAGRKDAVERLCMLAQAVVNQDHVVQRDALLADGTEKIANVRAAREFTTRGGRRLPFGRPKSDHDPADEKAAPGHQGAGFWQDEFAPATTRRRRSATGSRRDSAILRNVEDEIRDKVARQASETALTERKQAWMLRQGTFAHRDRASERQQEAAYLVHVLGWSHPEAAKRMKVSKQRVQALLKDYAKNAG
jgi:hypothetical protein